MQPVTLVTDNRQSSCVLHPDSWPSRTHLQTPSHPSRSITLCDITTSRPLDIAHPSSLNNVGSHLHSSFLFRWVSSMMSQLRLCTATRTVTCLLWSFVPRKHQVLHVSFVEPTCCKVSKVVILIPYHLYI